MVITSQVWYIYSFTYLTSFLANSFDNSEFNFIYISHDTSSNHTCFTTKFPPVSYDANPVELLNACNF